VTPPARSLVLRWAANGALAGAGSAGILMWADRLGPPGWQNAIFLATPGLLFGLAVGIPLSRRAGEAPWRLPAFVAGSMLGWPAAWYTAWATHPLFGPDLPTQFGHALGGLIGGLLWGAILMLGAQGFAALRPRRAWFRLLLAGGLAGALCMAFLEPLGKLGFGAVFLTLWGVWYAVQGGLIAMALPNEGNGT
jgi:hypothetical protein